MQMLIGYNEICQLLKDLLNLKSISPKWPMHIVMQNVWVKDSFKVWNGPTDFNTAVYNKFINVISDSLW